MKVAVTGHTSGIGQGLYKYFQSREHEVVGFSRSNGYTLPGAAAQIVRESLDCDIFVNNALPVDGQILLLKLLWPQWEMLDKTIIIVGTIAVNQFYPPTGIELYQKEKRELDDLCKKFRYRANSKCQIICIHPEDTDTPMFRQSMISAKDNVLSVDEVVQIVDYVLHAPVSIKDITFAKL